MDTQQINEEKTISKLEYVIQSVIPQKDRLKQFFTTLISIALVFLIYHFFFAPKNNYAEDLHEHADQVLQERIAELEESIESREQAYIERNDSIGILKEQLRISNNIKYSLQIQLEDEKRKLQKATDSDNVDFYINYINSHRSRNSESND